MFYKNFDVYLFKGFCVFIIEFEVVWGKYSILGIVFKDGLGEVLLFIR